MRHWFFILLCLPFAARATTYHVNTTSGDDSNSGTTPGLAWQTVDRANEQVLLPGDTLLFHAGERYPGQLTFDGESGIPEAPIFVGRYGDGKDPVLDGDGHLATVYILNSGYLHLSALELTNDGGPSREGTSPKLRYGIYLENDRSAGTTMDHFRFRNLSFRNIYTTVQINDDDQTGVNAHAIRTNHSNPDPDRPVRFRDMVVENCYFTRTGRHAVVIGATDGLVLRYNLFEHVGGAGMVIAAHSRNILVEGNTTDHTGSDIDPRMAARGSGLWAYRTTNLIAQHNRFLHARGIKDSFGMHIDIGNRNVVYQYNYSEDNEGGFVEVLGANRNVGYRYNVSVGDGWRSRGPQPGRTFWVGGWAGENNPRTRSDSVFIYNNTVYVPDTISPRIWIEPVTGHTRIYNNLVYVAGHFGEVHIKNDPALNDFNHNLWYGDIANRDTDGEAYRGDRAILADPMLRKLPDGGHFDLRPRPGSPGVGAGKVMYTPGSDWAFDGYDNHGGRDFVGNPVSYSESPHVGAFSVAFGGGDTLIDRSDYLREVKEELRKKWPDNRTVNLVFHGHSVPSGYFRAGRVHTAESYPQLLRERVNAAYPNAVVNAITTAIGGEQSEEGSERFAAEVLTHRPDVVFIDYALNDRRIGLERAKAAWEKMIVAAKKADVPVVLMTPTPDTKEDIFDRGSPLQQHAEQIRELAVKHGVGLVDSYAAFRQAVQLGMPLISLMSQGNHPNGRGHRLVDNELSKYFVE